jgi:hypothetical protein
MSYGAEKVVKAAELVPDSEEPICVVIGAIAKGGKFSADKVLAAFYSLNFLHYGWPRCICATVARKGPGSDWAKIRPLGDCLLGRLHVMNKVAPIFLATFFPRLKLYNNFDEDWFDLHFFTHSSGHLVPGSLQTPGGNLLKIFCFYFR